MGNSDQLLLIYVVQLCISQFHLRPAPPPPPPPRATAGHLPAMSVPGVGHLQKKAERQKGCSVDEERGICPLFSSPPWGIRQLKSPHSREFAIQGKKNANARGSARGGGGMGAGGIDWCIAEERKWKGKESGLLLYNVSVKRSTSRKARCIPFLLKISKWLA